MDSQYPMTPAKAPHEQTALRRLLGLMSLFTLFMTFPQVWLIWATHQAAGVSVISWGLIYSPLFFGFSTDCRNVIKTFICRASVGFF